MAIRPELAHMDRLPADTVIWPVGVGGGDPRIWASRETGEEIVAIQKEEYGKANIFKKYRIGSCCSCCDAIRIDRLSWAVR